MFNEILKQQRNSHKLSQEKLAEELNKKYDTKISKSMISRWENGQTDPQMNYVRIIYDYFNLSTPDETVKPADLADEDIVLSFEGRQIPPEDLAFIRRFLRGTKDDK